MLMSTMQPNRILAVEIRAARLGYAVLEAPKQLRDFGAMLFPSSKTARRCIARLLRLYNPSVLVLHGAGSRYPRNMRSRKRTSRIARGEATKIAVPVALVSDRSFKSFFERHSCRDKYAVAATVARWFPVLAWRVPPMPRFYDPEPRQMIYFDSIALGLVYLECIREAGQRDTGGGILSSASK